MEEKYIIFYLPVLIIVIAVIIYAVIKIFRKKNSFKDILTEDKKIFSPKRGEYSYKFASGWEASQSELTWRQDKKLAELFADIDLNNFKGEGGSFQFIKILRDTDIFEKFISIIFNEPLPSGDLVKGRINNLNNSEIEKVIADFFLLNPTAKKLLNVLNVASAFTLLPKTSEIPLPDLKDNATTT